MSLTTPSIQTSPQPQSPEPHIRRQVMEDCLNCGLCAAHCPFLSGKLMPGRLAAAYDTDPGPCLDMAFDCSLCGLCTALCPKKLDLPAMFLAWRQEAVASGRADMTPYHGILGYEKKGCSPLFSFYHLPENCNAVFFPGCTLTGTRPQTTLKAFEYLKTRIPGIGIVLDCCTKPSHDLGRTDFFTAMFSEMCGYLKDHGISRVITACPSCHALFSAKSPFAAVSVYEIMARDEADDAAPSLPGLLPEPMENDADGNSRICRAVVQDPCQARKDGATQRAVRTLAKRAGLDLAPLKASGPFTLCCGEGASVGCVSPGLAGVWQQRRQKAAKGHPALTYCAGCTHKLGRDSLHLLDLIFNREKALRGKACAASAPWTYVNRLRVKQHLKSLPAAHTRVRRYQPEGKKSFRNLGAAAAVLALLFLLAGAGIIFF